jgi:hypothetical protein
MRFYWIFHEYCVAAVSVSLNFCVFFLETGCFSGEAANYGQTTATGDHSIKDPENFRGHEEVILTWRPLQDDISRINAS